MNLRYSATVFPAINFAVGNQIWLKMELRALKLEFSLTLQSDVALFERIERESMENSFHVGISFKAKPPCQEYR